MVEVKPRRSPISQEGLDKAFINILLIVIGSYCRYDETACKRQYTGQATRARQHGPGNNGRSPRSK